MTNPFDKVDKHDEYGDIDDDQLDNSKNPDPKDLPKVRDKDDPELDSAP